MGGKEKYSFFNQKKKNSTQFILRENFTLFLKLLAMCPSIPCVTRMTKCLRHRIVGRELITKPCVKRVYRWTRIKNEILASGDCIPVSIMECKWWTSLRHVIFSRYHETRMRDYFESFRHGFVPIATHIKVTYCSIFHLFFI